MALLVVASLSPIITTTANRMAGHILLAFAPRASWLASAAIPSCLTILVIYLIVSSRRSLQWPSLPTEAWQALARLAVTWELIWLAGSGVAVLLAGKWIQYADGTAEILAFILFAPLGEELLFRGVIFELVAALWPHHMRRPAIVSTALFCLHHIQLHSHPFRGLALAQLMFTLPMGMVFATIRARSGSVWPAFLLHVATNIPGAI